jgi:hypothetical protein
MWGYLGEFWNAITGIGEYTIEWFQNIGNAVAGAIGGLFESLTHLIYDCFYLAWWFLDSLKDLFAILLTPITWAFNFGRGFFYTAFKTPEELGIEIGEIAHFGDEVFALFDAIPYVNYVFLGAGAGIGLLFLGFIIKKLSEV